MKRALLLFVLVCTISLSSFASETSSEYMIDDSQIENLFAASANVSEAPAGVLAELDPSGTYTAAALKKQQSVVYAEGKSAALAIVLDFFLGPLGIHRLYLGTKTLTWVGYILTIGGIFGIVPLVDFVVLIVNAGDISEYVDNPRYFMW